MAVPTSTTKVSEDGPILLRSYQNEMYEQSLKANTIVVMETGSGKTPVAIYRIMNALETTKGKLIWFLTGGVALCRQQHAVVNRAIPYALTRLIVGPDGPELWGSAETWHNVLVGVDIVFSTFAVLYSALQHAYVNFESLALLIFDEAHHVTKMHPANMIMKDFYHEQKRQNPAAPLPSILGLTASPAENGKAKKLSELERNLAATCRTPRKHRLTLRQHVNRPSLERLQYVEDEDVYLSLLAASLRAPSGVSENHKETLHKIEKKGLHLAEQLGCWAALTFFKDLEGLLEGKLSQAYSAYVVPSSGCKRIVLGWLNVVVGRLTTIHAQLAEDQHSLYHTSSKAQCFFRRLKLVVEDRGAGLVGIVFVRQRVVAAMLERLLASHPDFANDIRSAVFVGESNSASYEKELSELVVRRKQNEDALSRFRTGRSNLIIATDALDEGIDVAECNTIICFDPPQNLRSFIQKRGRARKTASNYIVLAPPGCLPTSPEKFEEMEELMSTMIQTEEREAEDAKREESLQENVDFCLRSVQTEAVLTAKDMRAHLDHYCAKLPRIAYTETRPIFSCEDQADGLITAKVSLPMSVPSEARNATSKQAWRTERAAIQDVAFQAYKSLYQCGLLTEHLLPIDLKPVFDDDFAKQTREFHHLGARHCVWDVPEDSPVLYRTSLIIRNETSEPVGAGLALWTKNDLTSVGNFSLSAEGNRGVLDVALRPSVRHSLSAEEVSNILAPCTRTLIGAVRSQQLSDLQSLSKFAVFITPDEPLNQLCMWLGRNTGIVSATELFSQRASVPDGLVVDVSNGNSLYVFRGWHLTEDDVGQQSLLEIECSPFPKRRNFLHTRINSNVSVEETEATADRITFVQAQSCSIRRLSVKYAWAMRVVPSIFYHMEQVFLGVRLKQELLPQIKFRSMSDLFSCIAAPSTMLRANYERCEYLGDCILKFYITEKLYCEYPLWHEEHLTRQRNTIISNISLAKAAVALGIDKYILIEPFVGKNWSVPTVESIAKHRDAERHLRMKILADVMEALIGAAFLGGGIKGAISCMAILLPGVEEVVEPLKLISPDVPSFEDNTLSNKLAEHAQFVIGHTFRHRHLLMQALTHPSCVRAVDMEPYQRLEFLGDAILDHLVTTALFDLLPPDTSEAQMTRVKASLVNGDFLAFLCYSRSELVEGVEYTATARDSIQAHAVQQRLGLWMIMRCEGEAVLDARKRAFDRFEGLSKRIADIFEYGKIYPWEELCMLHAPKFVSDVIESILGAIYVDAAGDLDPCRAFLEKIGVLPQLRRTVAACTVVEHPKAQLSRWLLGSKMQYIFKSKTLDLEDLDMTLAIDDEEVVSVSGSLSKSEAIIRATNRAIKLFESGFRTKKSRSEVTDE